MWNDAGELVIASGGQIYVAPIGTAVPATAVAALNAAWLGLGFVTDDGCALSVGKDVSDVNAWQAFDPIAKLQTARTIQSTFALQQWNENTIPLAFGGGEVVSDGSTGFKYEPPEPEDGLDYRMLLIEAIDGDVHTRTIFRKGLVSDAVETTFNKTSPAVLPITFAAVKPDNGAIFTILSDAPGFAAGS